MFKKNDPLVHSVKAIMEQNELHRRVEAKLCEELGIYSRKALPREHQANYDALLEQRVKEATDPSNYSDKQKKLAAVGNKAGLGGNPNKIDAPDLAGARKGHASHIEEANRREVGSAKAKKGTKVKVYSSDPNDEGSVTTVRQGKRVIATGDYDLGAKAYFTGNKKGNSVDDTGTLVAKRYASKIKEEDDGEETREGGAVTRDGKSVVSPTATRAGESSARRPASEGPSASDRQALTNKIKGLVKEEDQDIHSNQPTNLNKLKSDITSAAPNDSAKTSSPDESPIVNKPAKSFMETNHKKLDEKASEKQQEKVAKVMGEFKKDKLHSGSKKGPEVTSRKQAIAIALNQAGMSKDKKMNENFDLDAVMEEIARNLGEDNLNKIINKD